MDAEVTGIIMMGLVKYWLYAIPLIFPLWLTKKMIYD